MKMCLYANIDFPSKICKHFADNTPRNAGGFHLFSAHFLLEYDRFSLFLCPIKRILIESL